MRFSSPLCLLLLAGSLAGDAPSVLAQGRPALMLHPTKIHFEGRTRGATLHLVNRGDAPGTFVIGWVDYRMTPEGGLETVDAPAWSVREHVRVSPGRVTLEPGGHQVVRLALRPRSGVGPGEYRSHLRVVSLPVGEEGPGWSQEAQPGTTVRVRPRPAMAVPVTWRNVEGEAQAEFGSVRRDDDQLVVEVQRLGRVSLRGQLRLVGPAPSADGEAVLADPLPVVIYPELAGRTVRLPLEGASLPAGTRLELVSEPGADGRSRVLASRPVA